MIFDEYSLLEKEIVNAILMFLSSSVLEVKSLSETSRAFCFSSRFNCFHFGFCAEYKQLIFLGDFHLFFSCLTIMFHTINDKL